MEDLLKDKEEIAKLLGQAERDYTKKVLSFELKKVEAYIVDQQAKDEEHRRLQEHRAEGEHEKIYSKITKYAWSDEGSKVKVYVTDLEGIKDVSTDNINCTFDKTSFDLTIQGYKGKDIRLCIPVLNKEVNPEKCKFQIKSSSISITLKKEKDGKWTNLGEGEGPAGMGGGMPGMGMPGMGMPGMGGAGMGMPGMGGAGMEGAGMGGAGMGGAGMGGAGEGDGGQADMMEMMKKMYSDGDENTKKMMTEAMMKGQQDMGQ